jgi:hypothetical protein
MLVEQSGWHKPGKLAYRFSFQKARTTDSLIRRSHMTDYNFCELVQPNSSKTHHIWMKCSGVDFADCEIAKDQQMDFPV